MRWFLRGGVRVLTRIQHLLSILKHKNNEKACEKCEFVITDGPSQTTSLEDDDEERDTLESRLTVRLHCKHGEFHSVPTLTLPSSFTFYLSSVAACLYMRLLT